MKGCFDPKVQRLAAKCFKTGFVIKNQHLPNIVSPKMKKNRRTLMYTYAPLTLTYHYFGGGVHFFGVEKNHSFPTGIKAFLIASFFSGGMIVPHLDKKVVATFFGF